MHGLTMQYGEYMCNPNIVVQLCCGKCISHFSITEFARMMMNR
jgi:hypothetical protein